MITDKITNYTDTGSSHPVDPSFLVQEYEALLNAFRKNPDQQTAQNLYNFLNAHQAELEQIATSTDYDPFPLPVSDPSQEITGETNALLQDLKAYLGGNQSVLPACFEWAKDLESWMGANTNPADVLKEFESLTQAFEQTGNPEIEKMLKTMLNTPGYEKALSLFAKDPAQFQKDTAALLQNFNTANLNQLLSDL